MISIRPGEGDDLPALAALAAAQQERDDRFVIYCGEDAAAIAAEVEEVADWASSTWVAVDEATDDATIVGWLLAEVDAEIGRIWWWGPFLGDEVVEWGGVADRLYTTGVGALGGSFAQEELAFDDRHRDGAALAARHGFDAGVASALLSTDRLPTHDAVVSVRPVAPADRELVIALHEELFADAHLTGRQLVDDVGPRQYRSVAVVDDRIVGYVASEIQPDGGALIDFVGVAPSRQGNGIGRDLVADAVRGLIADGADRCSLTVRENNTAARRLYAALGFEQERMLRPFRKGFTLG